MEEDIEYIQRFIKRGKICGEFGMHVILKQPFFERIENLINKNKELKLNLENKDKESHLIQSRLDEANAKIIELNKIIDLMAKDIAKNDIDEDICRKVKNKTSEKDDCYGDDYDMCKDCVIEHYKKKVRDEE